MSSDYPHQSPFMPIGTLTLNASGTADTDTLESDPRLFRWSRPRVVRIAVPTGGDDVYIHFDTSAVDAVNTDMRVLAGTVELFTVEPRFTYVSALSSAGNAVAVNVTIGHGQ